MIRANELRIGNLCEYLVRDELATTKEEWVLNVIDAEDILYLSKYPDCENYRPIVLTPEVLGKCGFERDHSVKNAWFKGDILVNFENGKIQIVADDSGIHPVYFEIDLPEHFHQFQNLHFALTGEELNYLA